MRQKSESLFKFSFVETESSLPKTVRDYRSEYRAISRMIDGIPKIIDIAHNDFASLSSGSAGRKAFFSSESLFRALIVKQKEGIDYREACIRICESEFLQDFCMFTNKNSIDYTTLCKSFGAISPESWCLINQLLANKNIQDGQINVDVIRTDSTVVESNIHWPTDSSLLWDVYRVIDRVLSKIRQSDGGVVPFRFHIKKIKKFHIFVTRYASSKSKKRLKQVSRKMKKFILRVEEAIAKTEVCLSIPNDNQITSTHADQLIEFLPSMKAVVTCARKRWIDRVPVPIEEKVFSIFEPHAELIQRGRREKPIEFGHKIVINQTKEKFISGYQVLEHKVSDQALLETVIEQHSEQYGKKPYALAADKGFCPDKDTLAELAEGIEFLEVPRSNQDYSNILLSSAQQFRAGIEGSISCLKRAFRLSRCFFKGFKNFSSAVGSAIFCHNLLIVSRNMI